MSDRLFILILTMSVLTGCASNMSPPQMKSNKISQCLDFYQSFKHAIASAHVGDVQTSRIDNFPYLQSNRFLSSFRNESLEKDKLSFWLDQLQNLAKETQLVEFNNLSLKQQQQLIDKIPNVLAKTMANTLTQCATSLRQHDFQKPEKLVELKKNMVVADSYSTPARIFGLYPITKYAMYWANRRSRKKFTEAYLTRLDSLPVRGKLTRYIPQKSNPGTKKEVEALLKLASLNPMRIPLPEGSERDRLFAIYAPILEIDVAHKRDDHIGRAIWPSTLDAPEVDPTQPMLYRKVSHARVKGNIMLQLTYTAWFPARTQHKRIDIEKGLFSGIMWRVTLTPEGKVLIYDSAHSCACYHMFYPSPLLTLSEAQKDNAEDPMQPQKITDFRTGERLVLRIAHLTHHLHRVYKHEKPPRRLKKIKYNYADYSELRNIRYLNTFRSLFDEKGMIPGSERLAGRIFWMMGVHFIGSMRQWGNHATAFTGRRHFDDPYLFERLFHYQDLPEGKEAQNDFF